MIYCYFFFHQRWASLGTFQDVHIIKYDAIEEEPIRDKNGHCISVKPGIVNKVSLYRCHTVHNLFVASASIWLLTSLTRSHFCCTEIIQTSFMPIGSWQNSILFRGCFLELYLLPPVCRFWRCWRTCIPGVFDHWHLLSQSFNICISEETTVFHDNAF